MENSPDHAVPRVIDHPDGSADIEAGSSLFTVVDRFEKPSAT